MQPHRDACADRARKTPAPTVSIPAMRPMRTTAAVQFICGTIPSDSIVARQTRCTGGAGGMNCRWE
jgi:hypothetical protein